MIRDRHPAVSGIPSDRPLRGLVVTLEPFYLVNTDFYDDVFERPTIATTVAYAHEVERTIAALRDAPDTGRRLLAALSPDGRPTTTLVDAAEGLPHDPNPLLDDAWDRFSGEWHDLVEN
jgi:hypothetical protein